MIPVARPSTGQEELDAIAEVMRSGWLGMGSKVLEFEEAIKALLGAKHAVAVNTGTSALHIALAGFGIGPGDEVIVPSLTYAASVQAIIATGARPVFAEAREADLLIDIDDVRRKITPLTRAVMPVHYCGQACAMDELLDLAGQHRFRVVEDAAHAFMSTYKGRKLGSFGHATCFSFDPIKVITCIEGGAVTLQDDEVAEEIRRKRILGIDQDTWHRYRNTRSWSYAVTTAGFRYHLSNVNAAVGMAQLQKLDRFIARRREVCRRYDAAFAELRWVKTLRVDYAEAAPFTYIVRVLGPAGRPRRAAFIVALKEREVGTGIHYIPNHHHPFFEQHLRGDLPVSTRLGEEIVTLPLYSDITDADVQQVIESVVAFDQQKGA